MGDLAATENTTSNDVTAIGWNALRYSTGNSNTAVGSRSQDATTTGEENTSVGDLSLSANTTGSNNTAVGKGA